MQASKRSELTPLVATSINQQDNNYRSTAIGGNGIQPEPPQARSYVSSQQGEDGHPKTTDLETVLHLFKGYMGAGCLSLPYAISQLGITGGIVAIAALSYWTSANCYTVVNIRRHMEKTGHATDNINKTTNDEDNDAVSEASSRSSITYPVSLVAAGLTVVVFSLRRLSNFFILAGSWKLGVRSAF